MKVVIEGHDLPGRSFCDAEGGIHDAVHVGVQVRREPWELVPGDSAHARWELELGVVDDGDTGLDFTGPAVHGRRGERFLYLTWGNVGPDAGFAMFRRAKLMLNRIEPEQVRSALASAQPLVGRVRLTDHHGGPRCARVDPPDLVWTVG